MYQVEPAYYGQHMIHTKSSILQQVFPKLTTLRGLFSHCIHSKSILPVPRPLPKKRMEQICRYVFLNSCFIFSYYYYRQNYSANIMCLCLIHTASIEELEELAETHLLGFLNKNSPERIWPNRPFKPKQMRTKIFVVPVKEVCHVNLTFPMEDISSW